LTHIQLLVYILGVSQLAPRQLTLSAKGLAVEEEEVRARQLEAALWVVAAVAAAPTAS
jgi:hypothetical protein